jgi:hypothetical protein
MLNINNKFQLSRKISLPALTSVPMTLFDDSFMIPTYCDDLFAPKRIVRSPGSCINFADLVDNKTGTFYAVNPVDKVTVPFSSIVGKTFSDRDFMVSKLNSK